MSVSRDLFTVECVCIVVVPCWFFHCWVVAIDSSVVTDVAGDPSVHTVYVCLRFDGLVGA